MKAHFSRSLAPLLAAALVSSLLSAAPAKAGPHVIRVAATVANTSGAATTIDHPAINGKPNLRMILTQYWTGAYNNHPVGFQYDNTSKHWQIINEDYTGMPIGANFNVSIPQRGATVNASPQNSAGDWTMFMKQKGNQSAILLVSHVVNPFNKLYGDGVHLQKNFGLWYIPPTGTPPQPGSGVWAVYNEDGSAPVATTYSLSDATKDPNPLVLTTTVANVAGDTVAIDNPVSNGNPNAVVFVSHVYNPVGATPNYHDKAVGVYYDGSNWRIFNQDGSSMPTGITFNVSIFPATTP